MGVPVLSLAGEVHAARVGPSLLTRVGLDECWAATAPQIVAAARTLAADAPRRRSLREGLRDTMRHSTVCEAAPFVADLESAYRAMVDGRREQQPA
jgi:predicted O-linked N-acetylglucosamine transferase (SPINDLY family)